MAILHVTRLSVGLLAIAGIAGCETGPTALMQASRGKSVADVRVNTVRTADSPVFYEATGTVKARLNALLSSKVMARVARVSAREGDTVRAGQVLVTLDPRELTAAVDIARANLAASAVGVDNARTTREMEAQTSVARVAQARAQLEQSRAALSAAKSKLDLTLAGPRAQEKQQAHLAVVQAESSLKLAKTQLDRVALLVREGALAKQSLDVAQNAYDVALAQRDTAVQAEKMSIEGSRSEDVRSAQEGVTQAQAAVRQSEANLKQAQASALQANVRAEEVRAARAQVSQSSAALRSAQVTLGYATVVAPFDGRVVQRLADPGAMAAPGVSLIGLEGGELRLEAIVPESLLARIRKGDKEPVRLDALNRDLVATVSEIVPQGDAATHSFVVKLVLPGDGGVKSGMFGRVRFVTGYAKKILVPTDAVWEREGLQYVFVVNSESVARLRIVTLGNMADGKVEVLSGLSPGDRIVIQGRDKIADGDRVTAR